MVKKREIMAYLAKNFLDKSNKNISYEAAIFIINNVDLKNKNFLDLLAFYARDLWPNKPVLLKEDVRKILEIISSPSISKVKNELDVVINGNSQNGKKRNNYTASKKTLLDFLEQHKKSEHFKLPKKPKEKVIARKVTPEIKKDEVKDAIDDTHELKEENSRKLIDTDDTINVDHKGNLESQISMRSESPKSLLLRKAKVNVIKTIQTFQVKESYESFNNMFKYRFYKLKQLLLNKGLRKVVKSGELKDLRGNEERYLIVMVYDKKLTKGGKGGLIIGEDEDGFVTIYVPLNGNLIQKFNRILLDSVIGIRFSKVSGGMVLCEDIIFVGPNRSKKRNVPNEPMKIAFIADLHVGSKQFLEKHFENFIKFINGKIDKPWVKKITNNLKFLCIGGDLVDGVGVYPNQREELEIDVIYDQFDRLYMYLEQINSDIEIIAIPGNHDPAGKFIPQPPIPNEFLGKLVDLPNIRFLGNPSFLSLDGVKVLLYHGQGLEDIASAMSIGIHEPTRMMVEELRNMHLLPLWGYKSIVPLEYDPLLIDEVPDIYVAGHLHRVDARITTIGGSLLVNASTFQGITSWQVKMGIEPTPGIFPIVELPNYDVYFIKCDDRTCELLNKQQL